MRYFAPHISSVRIDLQSVRIIHRQEGRRVLAPSAVGAHAQGPTLQPPLRRARGRTVPSSERPGSRRIGRERRRRCRCRAPIVAAPALVAPAAAAVPDAAAAVAVAAARLMHGTAARRRRCIQHASISCTIPFIDRQPLAHAPFLGGTAGNNVATVSPPRAARDSPRRARKQQSKCIADGRDSRERFEARRTSCVTVTSRWQVTMLHEVQYGEAIYVLMESRTCLRT